MQLTTKAPYSATPFWTTTSYPGQRIQVPVRLAPSDKGMTPPKSVTYWLGSPKTIDNRDRHHLQPIDVLPIVLNSSVINKSYHHGDEFPKDNEEEDRTTACWYVHPHTKRTNKPFLERLLDINMCQSARKVK